MPWYHQGSMSPKIAIDRQRLADFCRRHHIRRLALFGSVLRDDFTPQSDVDVLVEFDRPVGLFELAALRRAGAATLPR